MKGIVMPSMVHMEPELLKSLVEETQENIETDIQESETTVRSFGIVDLWNVRRNSVSASERFKG